MKKFLFINLIIIFPLILMFLAPTSFAQEGNYTPLEAIPGTIIDGTNQTNFETYANGIFFALIGVASMLVVIFIVIGGIRYMTSDSGSGKSQAKEMLTNAITGLIIILGAWILLYTINPNLVGLNISLVEVKIEDSNKQTLDDYHRKIDPAWDVYFKKSNSKMLIGPYTQEQCEQKRIEFISQEKDVLSDSCQVSGSCKSLYQTNDPNRKWCFEILTKKSDSFRDLTHEKCQEVRDNLLKDQRYSEISECVYRGKK